MLDDMANIFLTNSYPLTAYMLDYGLVNCLLLPSISTLPRYLKPTVGGYVINVAV